jgi:hypothetical protein
MEFLPFFLWDFHDYRFDLGLDFSINVLFQFLGKHWGYLERKFESFSARLNRMNFLEFFFKKNKIEFFLEFMCKFEGYRDLYGFAYSLSCIRGKTVVS